MRQAPTGKGQGLFYRCRFYFAQFEEVALLQNWEVVQVSSKDLDMFTRFNAPLEIPAGVVNPNAGVVLYDETGNQKLGIYDPLVKGVRPLTKNNPIKGMKPKNKDLNLLYDYMQNDVDIIIVDGLFGTGKTSTVMAHACQHFYDTGFKLALTKPHVPVGRSYGHLPGDLIEKTDHEFESFYQYITKFQQRPLEVLMLANQLEVAPLEYIRGRDIPYWLIVDEAQNLSREEAITLASRVADGGKLILLGDTSDWQKDTKHKQDGLTFLYNLLKNEGIIGYVEMRTPEHVLRGRIAKALARALMKEGKPV